MSEQHEQEPDRAAEPREPEHGAAQPIAIPPRPLSDARSAGQAGAWWMSVPPAPAAAGDDESAQSPRPAVGDDEGEATVPLESAPELAETRADGAAEHPAPAAPPAPQETAAPKEHTASQGRPSQQEASAPSTIPAPPAPLAGAPASSGSPSTSGAPVSSGATGFGSSGLTGWGGARAASAPRPADDATRPYGVPQPAQHGQAPAPMAPQPSSHAPASAVPYGQQGPQALSPEEARAYRGQDLSQMVGRSPYEEFGRFPAPGQPGQHQQPGQFGQQTQFGQHAPAQFGQPAPYGQQGQPQQGSADSSGFAWQGQASGGGQQSQHGQQTQGQPGFGMSQPQQLPDYERSTPKRRSPGLGIAAAALAVVALVLVCVVPGILPVSIGLALGGVAIVLGAMGLRRSAKLPSLIGIAGGSLAAVIAVVTYIVVAFF
ncbi:hypothetical protein USB125703_00373 [Pseudoclavibacter triregionum]|nr:hypothetical protein USB125703_00373 [Pseudoclavibacter triregionum]